MSCLERAGHRERMDGRRAAWPIQLCLHADPDSGRRDGYARTKIQFLILPIRQQRAPVTKIWYLVGERVSSIGPILIPLVTGQGIFVFVRAN